MGTKTGHLSSRNDVDSAMFSPPKTPHTPTSAICSLQKAHLFRAHPPPSPPPSPRVDWGTRHGTVAGPLPQSGGPVSASTGAVLRKPVRRVEQFRATIPRNRGTCGRTEHPCGGAVPFLLTYGSIFCPKATGCRERESKKLHDDTDESPATTELHPCSCTRVRGPFLLTLECVWPRFVGSN